MDLYDFNQIIDRKASNSVRWDKYPADTIPLWVADMDFQSPPCVINALKERVSHGVYGYTHSPTEMKANIAQYLMDQYHWQVDPEWIEIIPRVFIASPNTVPREMGTSSHLNPYTITSSMPLKTQAGLSMRLNYNLMIND